MQIGVSSQSLWLYYCIWLYYCMFCCISLSLIYSLGYWAVFSNPAVQLQTCHNKVELSWVETSEKITSKLRAVYVCHTLWWRHRRTLGLLNHRIIDTLPPWVIHRILCFLCRNIIEMDVCYWSVRSSFDNVKMTFAIRTHADCWLSQHLCWLSQHGYV